MKRIIIEVGYRYYLAPQDADMGAILNVFSDFIEVERNYYDGKEFFNPVNDKRDEIEIKMVPAERVRDLTPEEKENKKIKELESSLSYQKDRNKAKDKEIENLKCQLELLKQSDNTEPNSAT